ncbi:MAG TPA: TIGR04255 family protein [Polyangiaceae bacterium]|jgi:uncharacterized protein (TIGR04255 family)|nr:TIGR04255 family protein [Polyangiaceae bacterium]
MEFLPERHYAHAPITEAVIDFGVQLSADPTAENLGEIRDESYAQRDPVFMGHVQFGSGTTSATQQALGWRFRSADGPYIYQVRTDGFALSRLTPYENWDNFSSEARRIWDKYRAVAKPITVQRIALRYINRIDIPLPLNDFGEYLQCSPSVSPHLPQGLSNYLMSLTIPLDELVTVVVNEAILNQVTKPNAVSILLDIGVSQSLSLPFEEEALWERFGYLRKVKNHVFEACITDKTRELFQ